MSWVETTHNEGVKWCLLVTQPDIACTVIMVTNHTVIGEGVPLKMWSYLHVSIIMAGVCSC